MMESATTASTAATTQPVTDLTDLFNSVGTAVLPLLTLFGEQATKQFFYMSTSWADGLLLASGPMGIMTVVVMAIRVGGFKTFTALIGRARESRVTVEQEFLPSTSDEICELWTGRDIVRVAAKPKGLNDLVVAEITSPDTPGPTTRRVWNISHAYTEKDEWAEWVTGKDRESIAKGPSNLSLNVQGAIINKRELWFWAIGGLFVQLFVLAFPGIAAFYWNWTRKGGAVVPVYAYWCFLSGSIALMVGLLGCAHVVQASTTEFTMRGDDLNDAETTVKQMLRLQFKSQAGSQVFPSCAILNRPENMTIRASRLNSKFLSNRKFEFISFIASVMAVLGFLCQVVGLSGLHWSAAITVSFFSLLMTGIRAWVRRAFAEDPWVVPIPDKFELGWTAMRIMRNDWDDPGLLTRLHVQDFQWGILTGSLAHHLWCESGRPPSILSNSIAQWTVQYSERLRKYEEHGISGNSLHAPPTSSPFAVGFLTEDETKSMNQKITEVDLITDLLSAHADKISDLPLGNCWIVAKKLATAIERLSLVFRNDSDLGRFDWKSPENPWYEGLDTLWQVDVQQKTGDKTSWFIPVSKALRGMDSSDRNDFARKLCAALYLWVCSLRCGKELAKQADSLESIGRWYLDSSDATTFLRIMGHCGEESLNEQMQDIKWWCGHEAFIGGTFQARGAYDGKKSLEDTASWPVFGLYHSAAFRMHTVSDCFEKTQRGFSLRSRADAYRKQAKDIVYVPQKDREIETECALEIFSLFMLSVCMVLERVGHKGGDGSGDTDRSLKARQKEFLEQLAQPLVHVGLVDSRSEGMLYIVPAFLRFDLLGRA